MFKKTAIALTLFSLSLTASASDWQVGGGFGSLSESSGGEDISLNIIYGSAAYKIQKDNSNFFFVPELRIGTGIGDDSVNVFDSNISIEVDRFIALSIRGQLDYDNGAYIYIMPSYTNFEINANYRETSTSDKGWELGIGAGVGYRLNKNVSVEAGYETYDDANLLTVSFKYTY